MEVLEFFRISNEDFNYYIKKELLIPSTKDGKIKYCLSNIMGCMSLLIAWEKTALREFLIRDIRTGKQINCLFVKEFRLHTNYKNYRLYEFCYDN